jgi:hypothetical protein
VVGGVKATTSGRPESTYGMWSGRTHHAMRMSMSLLRMVLVTVFRKSMSVEE